MNSKLSYDNYADLWHSVHSIVTQRPVAWSKRGGGEKNAFTTSIFTITESHITRKYSKRALAMKMKRAVDEGLDKNRKVATICV